MKYYGQIGFADTVETVPGVWSNKIFERNYYGDLVRNTRRLSSSDKVNDDIVNTQANNEIYKQTKKYQLIVIDQNPQYIPSHYCISKFSIIFWRCCIR